MSDNIDDTTIETFVGDDFEVTFTGLQDLIGKVIYLGVRDEKSNKPVFEELREIVNENGEVTFNVKSKMTNNFVVKPFDGVSYYLYGIKQVNEETGEENTILLGENPKFSDRYIIKVYLKKVEGIVEQDG